MTLREVAALSHLGWDTVKEIVKSDLGRRYRRIPLRHVRYLAHSMSFTSGAKAAS